MKRLRNTLTTQYSKEQAEFRGSYSIIDHLHTINQFLEKSKKHSIEIHLAFIDFRKAFDSLENKVSLYCTKKSRCRTTPERHNKAAKYKGISKATQIATCKQRERNHSTSGSYRFNVIHFLTISLNLKALSHFGRKIEPCSLLHANFCVSIAHIT